MRIACRPSRGAATRGPELALHFGAVDLGAAGDRESEVREALIDALEPVRTADGGYQPEKGVRFLVARAYAADG